MKLCYIIVGTFLVYPISSKEVYVRIEPADVYLNTQDVKVTCVLNTQIIKNPYITIWRNGWFGKNAIVTVTTGNPPAIGYFFSSINFTNRMEVTGGIAQKQVHILLKTVNCFDEAHYECEAGGLNYKNELVKFQDTNILTIKSHTERPVILINNLVVPEKIPIGVRDGDTVLVECDAHVGKPPKTMYWYRYDPSTSTYVTEKNLVRKAERRLPVHDLCRWYTTYTLSLTASLSTPEIRLRCRVDSYEEDVIIQVVPRVRP